MPALGRDWYASTTPRIEPRPSETVSELTARAQGAQGGRRNPGIFRLPCGPCSLAVLLLSVLRQPRQGADPSPARQQGDLARATLRGARTCAVKRPLAQARGSGPLAQARGSKLYCLYQGH